MKKLILAFSLLGFVIATAFTGGDVCNGNDFFIQGVKSKMGYYNAEGTSTGTGTSEVKKVYTSVDSTIAIISSVYTDTKNTPHPGELKIACVNGNFVMDMGDIARMNSMPQRPGHELQVTTTGNLVGYKQNYAVGEKLDSIHMITEAYDNGALMMTSVVHIYDRVVEAYEDLTVPAGTYKCYKISYKTESRMQMHNMNMPGGKPHKSVMYYCPKLGMVRMEQYMDDKLYSYSQLLELTKP
jgi:hypothetical protein